jgi:hypothetical protein
MEQFMSDKNIANMTEMQLVTLATELGIAVSPLMNKKELISAITLVQQANTAEAENKELAEKVVVEEPKKKERKFRLLVQNQEGVDNTPYIVIGVDGKVYQIPRDTEVEVPEQVIDTLKEAVMTLLEQRKDDQGRNIVVARKAPRFPFHVLGEVA